MALDDILKMLMMSLGDKDHDCSEEYKNWVQCGTLTSCEILARKKLERKVFLGKAKARGLLNQVEAIKASLEANGDRWWLAIHKNHSLPPANYHLEDDGRIMMEPGSVNRKDKHNG